MHWFFAWVLGKRDLNRRDFGGGGVDIEGRSGLSRDYYKTGGSNAWSSGGSRNLSPQPKISGEITLIHEIPLKIAQIDGEFPAISSKCVEMTGFTVFNRKNSAYFKRN
ncbi:MAG: hypothetical protein AB2374_09215 [Cytobacillus gottheilii]|uniref:hypothetical protein n=1 Tax=Cytobacillus gottheilii TaxID=859144 RepID=UPI0034649037